VYDLAGINGERSQPILSQGFRGYKRKPCRRREKENGGGVYEMFGGEGGGRGRVRYVRDGWERCN